MNKLRKIIIILKITYEIASSIKKPQWLQIWINTKGGVAELINITLDFFYDLWKLPSELWRLSWGLARRKFKHQNKLLQLLVNYLFVGVTMPGMFLFKIAVISFGFLYNIFNFFVDAFIVTWCLLQDWENFKRIFRNYYKRRKEVYRVHLTKILDRIKRIRKKRRKLIYANALLFAVICIVVYNVVYIIVLIILKNKNKKE